MPLIHAQGNSYLTLVEVRTECRRLKQRKGLKMVVIDYLQLLTSGHR